MNKDKEYVDRLLKIINNMCPCMVVSTKENLNKFKDLMNKNSIDITNLKLYEIENNFKLGNTSDMILFLPTLSNKNNEIRFKIK